jgi:2-amino-4-hydroxy-6-hydroxymethyldihydropteridine diphosphokinase
VSDSRRAVLALGSNLGDRLAMLQAAVDAVSAIGTVVAVSPVYETDPVGGPEQDDFLNAVVVAETSASPRALLQLGHQIEAAQHRVRREHWGPRTLDVDVIAVGDIVVAEHDLVVPHPRAHERAFVLVPWAAADAAATLPGHGRVDVLLEGLDASGVRLRTDLALRPPSPVRGS